MPDCRHDTDRAKQLDGDGGIKPDMCPLRANITRLLVDGLPVIVLQWRYIFEFIVILFQVQEYEKAVKLIHLQVLRLLAALRIGFQELHVSKDSR